jgi:hypothetical protein
MYVFGLSGNPGASEQNAMLDQPKRKTAFRTELIECALHQ